MACQSPNLAIMSEAARINFRSFFSKEADAMLGSSLTTEVFYRSGVPVVHATGEVDLSTAPMLKHVLTELAQHKPPSIVLNLEQVTYFDASGLNALLGIRRVLDPHGGSIMLVSPGRMVARVLKLIGIDCIFPVYPSLEKALVVESFSDTEDSHQVYEDHQVEITIQSRPEMVSRARKAIERLARRDGFSSSEVEDIKLAVSEACTNAIRHGSPDGPGNSTTIRYIRKGDRVVIEVTDQGKGFSFADNEIACPDEFSEGKRGLYLISMLMDDFSYKSDESGGILKMEKIHCRSAEL